MDSAVEVFSNDDVSVAIGGIENQQPRQELVSATMTSAFLLKEAVTRNYDVSNISRQLSGISDDDVSSDVITISGWIRRSAKEKLLTDVKNKGEVELFSAVAVANEDEPAVARSVVTKKRQQLSEQLLNKLLEYIQLLGRNQRSKWKESMAEIESCKCLKLRGQDLYYYGK
ncbi:hypothetical protein F511_19374 [Dorcoceras hygrometricum]|uniref:Uncharacterized protein n=1 Tax=Dorcoceras hygrometricum TaxID=472368 RepID=A0A2Z7B664_9LAMI|nr:hypothetical protein F511_19374 [Dorcoceras hygrometricum]